MFWNASLSAFAQGLRSTYLAQRNTRLLVVLFVPPPLKVAGKNCTVCARTMLLAPSPGPMALQ